MPLVSAVSSLVCMCTREFDRFGRLRRDEIRETTESVGSLYMLMTISVGMDGEYVRSRTGAALTGPRCICKLSEKLRRTKIIQRLATMRTETIRLRTTRLKPSCNPEHWVPAGTSEVGELGQSSESVSGSGGNSRLRLYASLPNWRNKSSMASTCMHRIAARKAQSCKNVV